MHVKTGFVYLRPLSIVGVRVQGPYSVSSPEAWRQMCAWLDDAGMRAAVTCGYGMMRDNPAVTPKEKCRYDACVELVLGFENRVPAGFNFLRLPGGAYARSRHIGIPGLGDAIAKVRDGWVPSNGLKVDSTRPFVEIYLDDTANVPAEKCRVDICVPVGMETDSRVA